jgi:hypothetical protein
MGVFSTEKLRETLDFEFMNPIQVEPSRAGRQDEDPLPVVFF